MSNIKVVAYKSIANSSSREICDRQDPEATEFEVCYPWRGETSYVTLPNVHLAESVARAMQRTFENGKQAAKSEIRQVLGVS